MLIILNTTERKAYFCIICHNNLGIIVQAKFSWSDSANFLNPFSKGATLRDQAMCLAKLQLRFKNHRLQALVSIF